jgi:hypothetical protein
MQLFGGFIEVEKEGGAKPTLHVQCVGSVPPSAMFLTYAEQLEGAAREGLSREDESKPICCPLYLSSHDINDVIRSFDEWFSHKARVVVIKHPSSCKLVWLDDAD